ncbi:uncharacterized protein NPIL_693021 [Nephila pilipes]|uniref:DUF7041 domain-containing protein n=1 Tax=Nephila pilipes TaxID=299642 RepID=A0A8X6NW37_NEPPI|nr:uncharacterized protein NPIL_364051 [Nephila pilipes]GFT38243.1 uncharacterized protein NPIL_693021 [Nephila pilipes]
MIDSGEVSNVNKIGVRIPAVWKSNIALWVRQCETACELAQITKDETKFSYLIANIDLETLAYVSDIVLNPPATDKFIALKNRLISEFQDSEN